MDEDEYQSAEYPLFPPDSHNYLAEAARLDLAGYRQRIFAATVTGTNGSEVLIRRDGQENADGQSYPANADVSFVADDRVVVIDSNGRGGWVVAFRFDHN